MGRIAPGIHGPLWDHIPAPLVLILECDILVLEIERGKKNQEQEATVSGV